jgi:(2Fe-2S) ferredoxin
MPVLQRAIDEAGLRDAVEVLATTCRNRCDDCPSLNVYPGPVFYSCLDEEAIHQIVREHLAGDAIARRWLYRPRIESGKRRLGSAPLAGERRRA